MGGKTWESGTYRPQDAWEVGYMGRKYTGRADTRDPRRSSAPSQDRPPHVVFPASERPGPLAVTRRAASRQTGLTKSVLAPLLLPPPRYGDDTAMPVFNQDSRGVRAHAVGYDLRLCHNERQQDAPTCSERDALPAEIYTTSACT